MPGTSHFGLTTMLDSDPLADVALAIRALADSLDTEAVRKPALEIVNNSTTLQNDNDLLFAAEAGRTYEGDFFLIFSAATSAIDAKIGFSFPAGTFSFGCTAMDPAVAAGNVGSGQYAAFSAAASGTSAISCGVNFGESIVRVSFSYVCTTAGNVNLMWAQNTLTAANLQLQPGSTMRVRVI